MLPFNSDFINVLKNAIRKAYQVYIGRPHAAELSDSIGVGSAFVLEYQGNIWFVTADHVVNPQNEKDFVRWSPDNVVGVATGHNDGERYQSMAVRLGGFYMQVALPRPQGAGDLTFPVPEDLTFCDANNLHRKCRTYGYVDDKSGFFVGAGLEKDYYRTDDCLEGTDYCSHRYFVLGTILEVARSGMVMQPRHRLHRNLSFVRMEGEEIVLRTVEAIDRTRDWSGLSGSAVLTEDGRLAGMLVRVVDGGDEIFVKPLNYIRRKIDDTLRYKASGVDVHSPYVVVPSGTTMADVQTNYSVDLALEIIELSSSLKSP